MGIYVYRLFDLFGILLFLEHDAMSAAAFLRESSLRWVQMLAVVW